MSQQPTNRASWMWIALCAVLAVGSLFLHPATADGALPLKYPLLGAGAVAALVIVVRLLRPLLRDRAGDDHAD